MAGVELRPLRAEEFEAAHQILIGAAEWLTARGIRQWTTAYPRELYLAHQAKGSNYGFIDGANSPRSSRSPAKSRTHGVSAWAPVRSGFSPSWLLLPTIAVAGLAPTPFNGRAASWPLMEPVGSTSTACTALAFSSRSTKGSASRRSTGARCAFPAVPSTWS